MGVLDNLNDMQKKAAAKVDGPVLILAGAGSGKTRTVTYRIAHMVTEKGISPYKILAVTFTNKAAKEMKERVESLIGDTAGKVLVSTFHSFGVRLLRVYGSQLGYDPNFNIYDTDDQKKLVSDIMKSIGINNKNLKPAMVVSKISKFKEDGVGPEEVEANFYMQNIKDIQAVYKKYNSALLKNNAMDFSDILVNTKKLLDIPEICERIQERYHYVMVDEYQDTNNIQYQIVNKIAAKYRNLCVVGDEDQSIYGFRGANIENILNFEKDYPDAFVIKLEQNYRSTENILQAANNMIKLNESSKGKKLWTDKKGGELIKMYEARHARDESNYVIDEIYKLLKKGKAYKDMTVLYRTNAQSRIFEETFIRSGVPYKVFGGMQFYQRKEIKDIIAYLNLINNPKDSLSLARVINIPKRKIGARTIEKLQNYADRHDISVFQAIAKMDEVGVSSGAKLGLQHFHNVISELIAESEYLSVSEIYDRVLKDTGYLKYLETEDEKADVRKENIEELKSSIFEMEKEEENLTLSEYLEKTSLVAATDDLDEEDNYVKLMTIHNSKGLEFPVVFIVGMEDEIFPSSRAEFDPKELEEERRLCYVAITRAEEKLYFCYANERDIYGKTSYMRGKSRFISEIPPHLIEAQNVTIEKYQPKEKKTTNKIENFNPFKAKDDSDSPYKRGEKVSHKKFGMGIVRAVEDGKRVVIEFQDGMKKFPLMAADKFITKL